jgi:hypothetical protein
MGDKPLSNGSDVTTGYPPFKMVGMKKLLKITAETSIFIAEKQQREAPFAGDSDQI